MSKHLFKSALNSRSVTVDIGWDAPLQHYYMTITAESLKPTDRPTIIYSSLGDIAIDGGASDPVHYWAKLDELHSAPFAQSSTNRSDGTRSIQSSIESFGTVK